MSLGDKKPEENDHGVGDASLSKLILRVAHCEHALLHCSSRDVRRYASALLSSCFKDLAKEFWTKREWRNATLFAAQAVAVAPSLRWILIALYTRLGALSSRLGRRRR